MTASPTLPDRDRLLQLIVDLAVVHGKVTLSSGREADWYIDMRRLTLHHEGAPLVGRVMRQLTGDLRYDVVGGLTLGADPVATAMLHAAADGVVAQVAGELAHHPADQRGRLVVEGHPAQVDVPVRLLAGGQRDLPAHHGEVDDELAQPVAVGMGGGPVPGARREGRGVRGNGVLLHGRDLTERPRAGGPRRVSRPG